MNLNEKITKLMMPKKCIRYDLMSNEELKSLNKWTGFKHMCNVMFAFIVGVVIGTIAVYDEMLLKGTAETMGFVQPIDYDLQGFQLVVIVFILSSILDVLPVRASKIVKRYTRVIDYDNR